MAVPSAASAAERWVSGLSGSTGKITEGVNAVTSSPTEAAASSLDRYLQSVTEAVQSGRMADQLRKVSLESWKQSFIQKGIPRIAGGARASQGKFENFLRGFLPFVEAAVKNLPPRGDFTQNLNRMNLLVTELHEYKGRGKQ